MPRIQYKKHRFGRDALQTIHDAQAIIADYQSQGYELTLRGLYYQMVSGGLILNNQKQYDRLGSIISTARMAGLIDWSAITDITRNVRTLSHWESPRAIMNTVVDAYHANARWKNQPTRIEVFIEKDALVSTFLPACQELDVPLLSCRGYTSQSELWAAAQRIGGYIAGGQNVVVLHFGDHDPSGIDMTRDLEDRLKDFLAHDWTRAYVKDLLSDSSIDHDEIHERVSKAYATESWHYQLEVRRMALNWDQVQQYGPPPNFAKDKDSRFKDYEARYGDESWELDALRPQVLTALLRDEVEDIRDGQAWQAALDAEDVDRRNIRLVAKDWDTAIRAVSKEA